MSEVVEEKSHGLKFAERQLLRHGWEHGKGLGRAENGISEAIKVKVKCDKGGVGHKEGEQFTFQWWDHVFNKASSSLQVESDQNGIKLKKTVEEDDEGMISNKKPRKASLAKEKLYGCFVKSATLMSGQEQPEPKTLSPSDSDSSSSEEEDDQRLDLSSTNKLSDSDLMKVCGGRTAHKGARHGLTMNAKLARLEQQEAEFMAKYGRNSQPAGGATQACSQPQPEKTEEEDKQTEKIKKKKKSAVIEGSEDVGEKPAKRRAEEEERSDKGVICEDNGEEVRRKHKKKKSKTEKRAASPTIEQETEEVKKKKKKSRKEPTEENKEERVEEEARDSNLKQKRKKCKKEKAVMEDRTDEEACPPKRKKKKKSKETNL